MRAIYHYARSYFGGIWNTRFPRTNIKATAGQRLKSTTVRKRSPTTEFTVIRRDKITPLDGDKDA